MIRAALCLVLALLSPAALAQDWRFGELTELNMEYYRLANNRDAYYRYLDMVDDKPGEYWDYGTAVNFNLDLVKYGDYGFRWRNKVRGDSTNVQFRSVAWIFRWGLQLGKRVEVFYDHHSEHVMDEAPPTDRSYQLRNAYGVEVWFYRPE